MKGIIIIFVLMCLLAPGPIAAESGIIKRTGGLYTVNDVPFTKSDIYHLLQHANDPEISQLLESSERRINGGTNTALAGLGLALGCGIAALFLEDATESDKLLFGGMAGGFVVTSLIGVAVYKSGYEQRDRAISIYNGLQPARQ